MGCREEEAEREEVKERKEWYRGKGLGLRDRGGKESEDQNVVRRKKTERGRKTVRVKAEARFMSPRIHTSFYRP